MIDVRSFVASLCRHTPMFKGKGRLVLFLDRWLTNYDDETSYIVKGKINSLGAMLLDLRSWGQKFAFYYGMWEKEYIDLARRLYRGGAFLDIGSSLGLYVICLGDLVKRAGKPIISIEPIAINIQKQKKNIAVNRLEDVVEIHQVALGDREATLNMTVDSSGIDNNAFVSSEGNLKVRVTTLDKFVNEAGIENIGFIKMDIEGYEPMVVEGGKETIRRDHPIIFAEFNRERMRINRFDIFPSWNFLHEEGYLAYQVHKKKLLALAEPGDVENIFFIPDHIQLSRSMIS